MLRHELKVQTNQPQAAIPLLIAAIPLLNKEHAFTHLVESRLPAPRLPLVAAAMVQCAGQPVVAETLYGQLLVMVEVGLPEALPELRRGHVPGAVGEAVMPHRCLPLLTPAHPLYQCL